MQPNPASEAKPPARQNRERHALGSPFSTPGAIDMVDPLSAFPFPPQLQRHRDYMRQRTMTIGDMLLENRIVFLGTFGGTIFDTVITDPLANVTIQQLLFLQYENRNQEIHFYINSPGGSVTSTLAIYDTMQILSCGVSTYCVGMAASGGAVLLAGGTKGKRYALPHAKIMIHQPYGRVGGQVSDIEIQADEILRDRMRLNEILASHTGQNLERISKDTDRDFYMDAAAAKDYGVVE